MNYSNIHSYPILAFLDGVFFTLSLIIFLNFNFPNLVRKSLDLSNFMLSTVLNSLAAGIEYFQQWFITVVKLPVFCMSYAKKWFVCLIIVVIVKALRCCLHHLEMMVPDSVLLDQQPLIPEEAATETPSTNLEEAAVETPSTNPDLSESDSEFDSETSTDHEAGQHQDEQPTQQMNDRGSTGSNQEPPQLNDQQPAAVTRPLHDPRRTSSPTNLLPQIVDELDLFYNESPFSERSVITRRMFPVPAINSNGSRGMVRKEPEFTYCAGEHSMVRSASPCAICLEEFSYGVRLRSLNCGHIFHVGCIDNWLVYQTSCPYRCR